jgi:hypothetical protein
MGWGNNNNITTSHLDSSSDDPSQARAEILAAIQELQSVIAGRNTTSGVAPLDAGGLIPAANLPNTLISSSGNNLYLAPATGVIAIDFLLGMVSKTATELQGLTPVPNMIAFCSNGDAGDPCLAVYTGDTGGGGLPIWYRIALGTEISVS